MDHYSRRLSLANRRLEILTRTETDLHALLLELVDLRERLRRGAAFGGSTEGNPGSKARASCYRRSCLACEADCDVADPMVPPDEFVLAVTTQNLRTVSASEAMN